MNLALLFLTKFIDVLVLSNIINTYEVIFAAQIGGPQFIF